MEEQTDRALFAGLANRLRSDEGAGLAEYAFLLILIAVVVIAFMGPLAQAIGAAYTQAANMFP